ncbi:Glycine cleavage system transcriptional activator [Pseudovibrio axinellae]|uniref:Glycine cleavage system transcriptional activator n=1 Tax=Pseudovibrio axinellae TaxID=989403 RepID=A0A166B9P7_9HYPH|nr:LysR substrate-binding domain-containing protein [Pseudovibrio axinellae]KZL22049.1 Glycine cleavage system transcriptional activator [Pseudovibrio axinellae]SEQ57213.1 DNA-binding transcriptional regulator, LysR family [Pseudovibrio axinellae]
MFNRLPSLNSFRVFEAAARNRSFKAAAEELHVTPTAVSHQIRKLEDHLGLLLFQRKTRAVELTAEGTQLALAARSAQQQLLDAIEVISTRQKVLTLSTTASFAAMWLVPRLEKFHLLFPEIQVVLDTTETVQDFGQNARIDLAIRYGQHTSEAARGVELSAEQFGLYASPNYIETAQTTDELNLIETSWKNTSLPPITWTTSLAQHELLSRPHRITRFDQEHHVVQSAVASQGIALVSKLLVQTAVTNGWLRPYKGDIQVAGLSYYAIIPEEKKASQKVSLFLDWITNEFNTSCTAEHMQ